MDWNDLYQDEKMCIKDPAEEVSRLIPLLWAKKAEKILDLGYGAGRHVVYLAKLGFKLYGTDISSRGEQLTIEWLEREGLKAELKHSDMTVIPYSDNFFDAIICRGVITHNTKENIVKCISEMNRVLKANGIIMCTFISKESSLFGNGVEVEQDTFICGDGIEKDVPHHFTDKIEVQKLMSVFSCIDLYHHKHEGLVDTGTSYVSAHWVYIGQKK